jgi:hypothetical protein
MPAGHLDLLFDQVEVVEQPFGRVGNAPGLVHGLSRAVVVSEQLFIFTQPREQTVGAPLHYNRVAFGEGFGMLDQLCDAEHLCAQRRFIERSASLHVLSHATEQGFDANPLSGRSVRHEKAKNSR